MGQVSVTVNARRFDITCDDGQERHVERLAAQIDRRVAGLAASLGAIGDARLLLLAALLIADDLDQAQVELAELRENTGDEAAAMAPPLTASLAPTLAELAVRIEAVAMRLKRA